MPPAAHELRAQPSQARPRTAPAQALSKLRGTRHRTQDRDVFPGGQAAVKLTNLGGATAILEHKGKRMLFDPWLNEGIFNGAWFHYPPLKMGIPDLGRFDYIYISH